MFLSMKHKCPGCGKDISSIFERESIPYFSDILIIRASCECGFRYVDVIVLGESDPVRYTIPVTSESDLSTRVVRSTSGIIRIPELGMEVEPGPACNGFISNIEGVLNRFAQAVELALSGDVTDDARERGIELLERIEEVKKGKIPVTIIIEDRSGNSAIISEKAKRERLEIEAE